MQNAEFIYLQILFIIQLGLTPYIIVFSVCVCVCARMFIICSFCFNGVKGSLKA